jgi:hypothetical protein
MSDFFGAITSKNANIPLRPLTKGMIRNQISQMLPNGAFTDVQGMLISETGLYRRPGFSEVGGGDTLDSDEMLLDLVNICNSGSIETVAITNKSLKTFNLQTGFADITDEDNVLNTDKINNVDWALVPITASAYSLVIADGSQPLLEYDGLTVDEFTDSEGATLFDTPKAIEFFNNRLFIGAPDSTHPNRIWWSNIGDSDEFDDSNYLDFLDEQEDVLRIKGLGNLLIVYFPKAVYFGRPTNRVDLPYAFTKIESLASGLVGKKAIVSWDDGHFFVSNDDVYFLSADGGIQPLNVPVKKLMLGDCRAKEGIYISLSPLNDVVIVGTPSETNDMINMLWFFNYKTKAWSRSYVSTSMLASIGTYVAREWSDESNVMTIDGTVIDKWDDDETDSTSFADAGFLTWRSLESSLSLIDLFICSDNVVYRFDELASSDFSNTFIDVLIESGDLDLDLPDVNKCFNRLSLKIDQLATRPIRFLVYTSNRRGASDDVFELQGELLINTGEDEGWINFKSYGSNFRFKLVSNTNTEPYTINEIILRGRPRGLEYS